LRFNVKATLPLEKAIVTAGGVSLDEIDPRTMASRKVSGLYFCGEVMDIDADTGGYNLQAAFSTGFVAGQSAAIYVTSSCHC
jgi:predicted flavoprotein YhiN